MVKYGNFTFLLLELILADQLADLLPPLVASSGQEWQSDISTVRAHIGRTTGRSTSMIVASSGNVSFLLLEFVLVEQLADLPPGRGI